MLAHDGQARGGKVDSVAARDYYTRACEGGFAASCFNLSARFIQGAPGLGRDMGLALQYALQACDLSHVWGCANASRMFKLGKGAPRDDAKAEALKNRARELHGQQQEVQLAFRV
ncbi:Cytochrome c oxidase assembly factor 7 [Acipenser ruthenus]|uniref:Cytochrome c oxidase assembly factor 7 n=1 Tax=Acipenser ruthenus TaxID=7906 RepID=A0A662YP75_ACIRT|nr:Cytochrome c oxidase assembly factor 7 [Acipenser ruthenus]